MRVATCASCAPLVTEPPASPRTVHVIGASGRSGAALCRALLAAGYAVVPIVRDAARFAATGIALAPHIADLGDHATMQAALTDATRIVSAAHARNAAALIAAAPPDATLVLLGSTRKYTRWPDAHGDGVIAGEAAFLASGRRGVMLHPTMIYGAAGEDNVRRLARLLRLLTVVPLPGGGASLVQPIHQDDVTRALIGAVARDWDGPRALVIAGPVAMTYADFVRAIAAATGRPRPRVAPLPAPLLIAAARATAFLPGLPRVRPDEVRRLLEDKAFDIGPMQAELGVHPIPLAAGLARTFGGGA